MTGLARRKARPRWTVAESRARTEAFLRGTDGVDRDDLLTLAEARAEQDRLAARGLRGVIVPEPVVRMYTVRESAGI